MAKRGQLLVLGLGMASVAALAQTQVQINGQVRLSVNRVNAAGSSYSELRDNASRLGFKGSEDLGDGFKALFGLEMGIEADQGAVTSPNFRHSYVGLSSSRWGTMAMGRLDSATPAGSPIYSQVTAITSFAANDAGLTAIGTSILNARNRTSNSIGYMSPSFAGFDMRARYYWRGQESLGETEDAARSLDLGVNYHQGPLKLALGYASDSREGGLKINEFDHKWQAGVRYDFGQVSPYLLYGRDSYRNSATSRRNVDYWMAGVRWAQGPHAVVANVMRRDVQTSLTGVRKRYQVAYTYALSKRTEAQLFWDNDSVDSSRSKVRISGVGAGLRHNF